MLLNLLNSVAIETWLWLAFAALLTGFLDAVVGGGGMVMLPTLFTVLPNTLPATLLGTNKLAGVFGTATAAYGYARKTEPPWRLVLIAAFAAFAASIFGAATVQYLAISHFKKFLPILLTALLLYTLWNKNLGLFAKKTVFTNKHIFIALFLGCILGFYDGVFGPGTGSLLVFLWVRWFSLDFLTASACAKMVNLACNLGALFWFVPSGQVLFGLAIWMALFTTTGAFFGARYALKKGDFFVRKVFIFVVILLIARTAYDAYGL
jgi:uncharacterized protein